MSTTQNIKLLLVMVSANIFSQENIVLQPLPLEIQNQSLYIKEVQDERFRKQLGFLEGSTRKKKVFRLYPSAAVSVKDFINISLSGSDASRPVYIKIKSLKIEQSKRSISEITTRVFVKLVFLEKEKNTLKELFTISHYEHQYFPISSLTAIAETHEKRIRAALEYCLRSFIHELLKNDVDANKLPQEIFEKAAADTYVPLGKWFNLLTYKKIYSKYNQGWRVSYIGFADNEKDFMMPFVMSYERYGVKSERLIEKKFTAVDAYTIGGGFEGYIKLIPGLYASFGLEIPMGIEITKDLNNNKRSRFLIGAGATQGLKIIPWRDFGVIIGVGVFQQVRNSKLYTTDLGFELEVGINF